MTLASSAAHSKPVASGPAATMAQADPASGLASGAATAGRRASVAATAISGGAGAATRQPGGGGSGAASTGPSVGVRRATEKGWGGGRHEGLHNQQRGTA